VIDCEVLTLDEAKLLKFIEECYKIWRIARSGAQKRQCDISVPPLAQARKAATPLLSHQQL
jgi:hypothetical protein